MFFRFCSPARYHPDHKTCNRARGLASVGKKNYSLRPLWTDPEQYKHDLDTAAHIYLKSPRSYPSNRRHGRKPSNPAWIAPAKNPAVLQYMLPLDKTPAKLQFEHDTPPISPLPAGSLSTSKIHVGFYWGRPLSHHFIHISPKFLFYYIHLQYNCQYSTAFFCKGIPVSLLYIRDFFAIIIRKVFDGCG